MQKLINKAMDVVTDEFIDKREKRWKKALPDSFRQFIKENNGGIPAETIVIDKNWTIERFFCMIPKISESENGEYDIDAVITKYDEFMVFDGDTKGYDLIPFAQLNHDSLLCLCYDREIPSVVVWQLEGSEEFRPNYKRIQESFDDFLSVLK